MHANPIQITGAKRGGGFTAAWVNVVNALGGMAVYQRTCFYLVNTALDLNNGKTAPTFRTARRAGLKLRAGRLYLFQIYQVIGDRSVPPKPGFTMKMLGVTAHTSVLRSELRIDGPYDRLSFLVLVLPQSREKNQSELLLTCDQTVVDPNPPSESTQLHPTPLELQIVWPRFARFMRWVGFPVVFVAGAAIFVGANLIASFFGLPPSSMYLVQLLGLSLLAIGGGTFSFLTGSLKSSVPGTKP